jgi:secondary thiamine-phosphate synthase enzyme
MPVETHSIEISTKEDLQVVDITGMVEEKLRKSDMNSGIANIFVPGSTGSISTIEYEPNLLKDFSDAMERLAPSDIDYEHHRTWGDRNGKSHIRATVMGPGLTLPFKDKKLLLGQWQQLVYIDFDVPSRKRKILITIIGD